MAFWNPKESSAVLPTPFEEIYLAQKYVKQLDTSPWLPLESLRFWKWPQLWSQIGWLAMGPALRLAPKSQTLYSLRPLWPHLSHTQRWFYRCHAFFHPHPPDNPRVPQYLINQLVRLPEAIVDTADESCFSTLVTPGECWCVYLVWRLRRWK